MTEEPKRRGRPPGSKNKKKEESMIEPPLTIDEPGFLEAIDEEEELTPELELELEEMTEEAATEAAVERFLDSIEPHDVGDFHARVVEDPDLTQVSTHTKPTRNKFIEIGNGLYLPVRQRIVWMRGEPEPHPDWLIQTEMLQFRDGEYTGTKSVYLGGEFVDVPEVKGGIAVFQARVLVRMPDGSEGPIIGEGSALERSELFHDYVEKAETAAIGRALAVAGYGTEAALDLDEGPGNIADAPVRGAQSRAVPSEPQGPINIEPSAVPGVRQGGRQAKATIAQIQAIRERASALMLAPSALQTIIRDTLPNGTGSFYDDDVEDNPDGTNLVLGFLTDLSFEDCGKVVVALQSRG